MLFLSLNACEGFLNLPVKNLIQIPDQKIRVGYVDLSSTQTLTFDGIEKELLLQFSKDLSLQIDWVRMKSSSELISQLKKGNLQIGMGRINSDLANENFGLLPGPIFEQTSLKQICSSVSDAKTPTYVLYKHAGQKTLSQINQVIPSVKIMDQLSPKELFQKVFKNKKFCLLLDKKDADSFVSNPINPRKTLQLPIKMHLGFLVSGKNKEVQKAFNFWFQKFLRNQKMHQLRSLYSDFSDQLDSYEKQAFYKKTSEELKHFKPYFLKMEKEFQLPWQLIAAVSFQESRWDHSATSPTGVRGFMMLTQETADFLGIKDRTSFEESLWGGSKYLRILLKEQPKFLQSRNQLMLALASYNVGKGHLRDAQKLAKKKGFNPYLWNDLKEVLPLLASKDYIHEFQYGKARGHEPVQFVHRVLGYYELFLNQI